MLKRIKSCQFSVGSGLHCSGWIASLSWRFPFSRSFLYYLLSSKVSDNTFDSSVSQTLRPLVIWSITKIVYQL